jgi:hypothetical protein
MLATVSQELTKEYGTAVLLGDYLILGSYHE